jgi:hypothetical protein
VIRTWITQLHPGDQFSIENALLIKNSIKWLLIIDPQNQASRWIKEIEGSALKICKSEDASLFRTVEQSLRLGQPILIENIGESIDSALGPILRNEIITKGAQKLLKKRCDTKKHHSRCILWCGCRIFTHLESRKPILNEFFYHRRPKSVKNIILFI